MLKYADVILFVYTHTHTHTHTHAYIRYEETNFGFGSDEEHAQGSLMLALCPAVALAPLLVALVGHAVGRIYSCDCWMVSRICCDCWKERKARRERWGKFVREHDIQCRAISSRHARPMAYSGSFNAGDQYTITKWTYVKDLCTELVKQNASLKCDKDMELVLLHPHQPNFDPKWGSKDRVYMLEGKLSVDNLLVTMVPKGTKHSRRQGGGGGSSTLKVAGADGPSTVAYIAVSADATSTFAPTVSLRAETLTSGTKGRSRAKALAAVPIVSDFDNTEETLDSIRWSDLSDEDYENVSAGQVNDRNGVDELTRAADAQMNLEGGAGSSPRRRLSRYGSRGNSESGASDLEYEAMTAEMDRLEDMKRSHQSRIKELRAAATPMPKKKITVDEYFERLRRSKAEAAPGVPATAAAALTARSQNLKPVEPGFVLDRIHQEGLPGSARLISSGGHDANAYEVLEEAMV